MAGSIGTFNFDVMTANPDLRGEVPEIFQQIGIDGWGLQRTGKRGQPFRVETQRYELTFASAKANYELYKAEVAKTDLELIWNGLSYGTYYIQSVTQRDLRAITSAVGTIETNPQALHICVWQLLG